MRDICNYCAYENSDCKGDKEHGGPECNYFKKPNVLNVKWLAEENAHLKEEMQHWIMATKALGDALDKRKRPTSRWIYEDNDIYCELCHTVFYYDENVKEGEVGFRFCPECGAYMANSVAHVSESQTER